MVKLLKSLNAHKDKAWSVAVHPTLPIFGTASTDKTSCVYSLKDGFPLLARLEDAHKRSVRSVSFKPPMNGIEYVDLPAMAAGSFDSTISIWGIDEPEFEEDFDQDDEDITKELKLQKEISTICSPRNEWNLMALIEGHENEVKSVAWNFAGNLLASCSRDKTVWIWETDPETLEEFECISVLNDHQQDVKHICWHPNKNMLASSSYDDTIRIYKEEDDEWTCVGVLNGHDGTVWCSVFEPNPKVKSQLRLASVSDDLSVKIWTSMDVDTGEYDENTLPSSIKKDSDMVWELQQELPKVHTLPIYSVCWSAKSGRIATVGSDSKLVVYSEVKSNNNHEINNDDENENKKNNNDDINNWVIDFIQEAAHGVFEINCVTWAVVEDKEVLITAGDDGKVNIWEV